MRSLALLTRSSFPFAILLAATGCSVEVAPAPPIEHTAPTEAPSTESSAAEGLRVFGPDGKEILPLAAEEVERLRVSPPHEGTSTPPRTPEAVGLYYGCDSWAPKGDFVWCGTQFFGSTSLYIFNEGPSTQFNFVYIWSSPGPVVYSTAISGNAYPIPEGATVNVSGWFWGQTVYFYNAGPNPLYITH